WAAAWSAPTRPSRPGWSRPGSSPRTTSGTRRPRTWRYRWPRASPAPARAGPWVRCSEGPSRSRPRLVTMPVMATQEQAAGVRWDLTPLFAGTDQAREALAAAIETAQAFAERWRGRMETLDGAELAAALAELGEIDNQLSRIGSYSALRRS